MKRLIGAAVLAAAVTVSMIGASAHAAEPSKKTARVWKSKCGSCHGAAGKADTKKGQEYKLNDMSVPAWQAEWTDEKMRKVVLEGAEVDKDGVKATMDPYKDELDSKTVDELILLIRSFGK